MSGSNVCDVVADDAASGSRMTDEEILAVALSGLIAMVEPLFDGMSGLDNEDLAMWHWARRVSAAHGDGYMRELHEVIEREARVEKMRKWLANLPPNIADVYQELKRIEPKGKPREK